LVGKCCHCRIKLSTDTDKDLVKTGRISGLISGIYYRDDLKKLKSNAPDLAQLTILIVPERQKSREWHTLD
jgi:hypothetical protein